MSRSYVLAHAAESDLREVVRYTREQWGVTQARTYTAKLQACMEALAKGQGVYRELPELGSGLRMMRCQHHYLFLLHRQAAPPVVLAILHERMDLLKRLKARLEV